MENGAVPYWWKKGAKSQVLIDLESEKGCLYVIHGNRVGCRFYIVAAGAVGAPGSRNSEEAVMEKLCKLECTSCQRRL